MEIKLFSNSYGTNRTFIKKKCEECSKEITVLKAEIKRGGGKFCGRICYYSNLKRTRPKGNKSWAWKGDNVGIDGLHQWVQKHLGKPRKCQHCKTTSAKQFDWANKSQEYKRDLNDWIRLCRSCHAKFDYPFRQPKWRESVRKLGWKV